LLKERGGERTGYRGCLVGTLVGGVICAAVAAIWSYNYTRESVSGLLPASLLPVLFGFVGFVAGGFAGGVVSLVLDVLARKKEDAEDEF
jgi:hypothetical protein